MTGADLYALAARLFPIPRSITGDGVRQSLAILAERHRPRDPRDPDRHAGLRLDGAARVAPARGPHHGARRPAHRRRRRPQPAPAQLQRPVPRPRRARRARAPPLHAARPARPDPVSHELLQGAVGLLPAPRLVETSARRRVRSRRRYRALRRQPHLRRARPRRRVGRGGAALDPLLPPVARQRQPLRHGGGDGARRAASRRGQRRRLSYRFLFLPGTIGAITWLATNRERAGELRHGLVLAGLGAPGAFHYKKSRSGDAPIDREVAARSPAERASRSRSKRSCRSATTSASTTPPASASKRAASRARPTAATPSTTPRPTTSTSSAPRPSPARSRALPAVVDGLESRECFRNLAPECEPQLGRRGLYRLIGGDDAGRERELAILWMLNLSRRHAIPSTTSPSARGSPPSVSAKRRRHWSRPTSSRRSERGRPERRRTTSPQRQEEMRSRPG